MKTMIAGIAMVAIAVGTIIGGSPRAADAAACRWSLAERIALKLAMPAAPYRHFAVIYSHVDGSYPGILLDDDMSADCVRSDWEHRPDTHVIGIVEVQLVHPYEVDTYNPPLTHWPIRFQAADDNQALCVSATSRVRCGASSASMRCPDRTWSGHPRHPDGSTVNLDELTPESGPEHGQRVRASPC